MLRWHANIGRRSDGPRYQAGLYGSAAEIEMAGIPVKKRFVGMSATGCISNTTSRIE